LTDTDNQSSKIIFASNLKRIMHDKNIKNKDLATAVGLSEPAISNYVTRISMPRAELLSKIAEALQVSVDELIRVPKTTLREDSNAPLQFEVPFFSAILASTEQIYRNDNFDGSIIVPFPVFGDYNCYAVKIYNDLLRSSGFAHGSLVVFAANTEVKSGQFAAVVLKDERKVVIRRVTFQKDKITLSTDETSVSYPNKKKDSAIEILGRVISATFSPNS